MRSEMTDFRRLKEEDEFEHYCSVCNHTTKQIYIGYDDKSYIRMHYARCMRCNTLRRYVDSRWDK